MKKGPLFLLASLTIVLVFIVGVRYGQHVADTNKQINYLLTVTPAKAMPKPSIEYKSFTHAGCNFSFLYPSNLEVSKQTTQSAVLSEAKEMAVELHCDTNNKLKLIVDDKTIATEEVQFQNKAMTVKTVNNKSTYVFKLKNIFIAVQKSLFPLFERTFQFTK